MRRIFTLLVGSAIFILGGFRVSGQTFSLEGSIDVDSGRVYLNYVSDDAYYLRGSGSLEAAVHKGKFVLRDSLTSPCAFQLLYKADKTDSLKYISGIFLLQRG